MRHLSFVDCRRKAAAVIALGLALFAPNVFSRSVYVLTTSNGIASVDDAAPGTPSATLPISGLAVGDTLVGIDVRPQNNHLYGLAYNSATSAVQLYLIETRSGTAVATAVGAAGSFVDAGGMPLPISGSAFDIDFNPSVDRLRVISNSGQSFRMNPNSGALVDGDLGMAAGSVAGLNPDGSANGAGTSFDAAAYTNNRANVTVTTLYTIDAASDRLFIVNPPNAGTLVNAFSLTLASSPLDISAESGFDIPSGIDVAAGNTPATGLAYAAFTVAGVSGLYRLELSSGAATFIGALGGLVVRDIAVAELPTAAQSLNASGTSLQRFLVQSPGSTVSVTITGVNATERLVGFDLRPATGQWIALGVDATANAATLYRLDPQTGAATMLGANPGLIAFVDAVGAAIDLSNGTYGVSFNPVVDRVRVVASNGVNFRANPNTGSPVDGDFGGSAGSIPNVNPDGTINGAIGSTGLDGAAYTSNFAGTTLTTLYTLDAVGDRLYIQSLPNSGTQTLPLSVTLNSASVDFASTTGFDVPPGPAAAANNLPVNGFGFAALTIAGSTRLYRIALNSGSLEDFGPIGGGAVASAGLVVGDMYNDIIFANGFQ